MFSTHVTKDISAYCHGELSHEESKQFEEHIISCAKCRAKFEEVKLGIKLAEQLPQLSAPDYLWRELARGKMSAHIWAPPRLFFVNTPSAVAADLGCAYTLEVDDQGSSLLRVTSGWVALELQDRESVVPAGAACETRAGLGPGTPYFENASGDFRLALQALDFNRDAKVRRDALMAILVQARQQDTLTLWHLLTRVDSEDRARVYDRMAALGPPPPSVTREGILALDRTMLNAWRDSLELTWMGVGKGVPKPIAEAYWRVKNGLSRRLKDMMPK